MKCPACGRESETVAKRRRNTMFVDEEQNYIESCLECFETDDHYWQERWDDLNADINHSISDALHEYYGGRR
jgi:hypothetical protein